MSYRGVYATHHPDCSVDIVRCQSAVCLRHCDPRQHRTDQHTGRHCSHPDGRARTQRTDGRADRSCSHSDVRTDSTERHCCTERSERYDCARGDRDVGQREPWRGNRYTPAPAGRWWADLAR